MSLYGWVKRVALVALGLLCGSFAQTAETGSGQAASAGEILKACGVQGGFVVDLGCGDGTLAAALRANDRYTVQGLESDPAKVEAAREHVESQRLYGPVSIEPFSGAALPYADNLVNLVVAENPGVVPMDEILRVLAPEGVAYVKTALRQAQGGDGAWEKTVKPRPSNIDEWSHFLHDPGNNAVANDTVVGPPRSLQWIAPPLWLRSHETPSGIEALVSSGGRVFYFFDEGLIGITDQRLPERWSLYCRDAFNGKLLWKRPLEKWGWPEWARDKFEGRDWTTITGGRTVVPNENQRRLVADGDRLYATLSFSAPLSILDAATGEVLKTVEEAGPALEFVASDGIVVVHTVNPAVGQTEDSPKRKSAKEAPGSSLIGVKGDSGEVLWRRNAGAIRSLALAIDAGRVVFQGGSQLTALDLRTGAPLWQTEFNLKSISTLVAHDNVVLALGGGTLEARDGATGNPLWTQKVKTDGGAASPDLFVIDGVVWPGMYPVDADGKPKGRQPNVMAVGYDLRTGEARKSVFAANLRSMEHHHRCFRNKATDNYIITAMEGAEFLDLNGDRHSQDNWLRGACRLGVMPCNGMLYVPADQCFCEPGAKLLGFATVGPAPAKPAAPVPDEQRLEKGEAYGMVDRMDGMDKVDGMDEMDKSTQSVSSTRSIPSIPSTSSMRSISSIQPAVQIGNRQSTIDNPSSDWPTYRHDPERHGSTPAPVAPQIAPSWRAKLGGNLTAPVVAGGRVYVAQSDAHTLHALDAATGAPVWEFIAGGRIDSPPTIYKGLVLFGSADGHVYALRASDGALAWRFLAAPTERLIGYFDQLESAWPVHGSVLMRDGPSAPSTPSTPSTGSGQAGSGQASSGQAGSGQAVAYVAAGRSTYLDGGIRLYGLDPFTGQVLYKNTLEGPFPDGKTNRDYSFYVLGANSDVLVSEGDSIYMRQKKLTPALEEVKPEVLSAKGEMDVGMHVFATSGLLDGSFYGRVFWMYSKRWPGFQLANQAPKSGVILVVDDQNTFGVSAFYRRNVHTTMFFPGKEGYLLFADKNTTEPQIVGEEGARPPVAWLPQSDFQRGKAKTTGGMQVLDSKAFGLDKMIGYTRADPPLWMQWEPIRIRGMVKAGDTLFVAGPPDALDPQDPYAAFEGRKGARLAAVSAKDGARLGEVEIDSPPVFDGLIAAEGRLFASLEDGSLACFAKAQ